MSCKILGVSLLLILLDYPIPVTCKKRSRSRRKRTNSKQEMHVQRIQCERQCLLEWVPEEAMNCVHTCRSPTCFEKLYGKDPLEPGQVDMERADLFDKCHLSEILERKKLEREARRNGLPPPGSSSSNEEAEDADVVELSM